MRLLEYQAKALFGEYGIQVPAGHLVRNAGDLDEAVRKVGFPLVLKAQLPVGGRGKAGAVVKVMTEEELKPSYEKLSSLVISGLQVREVLAEQFYPHEKEFYCSYFENRGQRCFSLIVTKEGGIDVEEVKDKEVFDFGLDGPAQADYDRAAAYFQLPSSDAESLKGLLRSLYSLYSGVEGDLVEINPLAYTPGRGFAALDAKVIVDDNALFRHPELQKYVRKDSSEEDAERYGFNFVSLDGDIAVVGNGAGLVLATLDMVSSKGLRPGCFLDLGGGASSDRVLAALKLLAAQPNLRAYFINVFGGITNGVSVAQGILDAKSQGTLTKPLVMRLSGAGDVEAREMLAREGLSSFIDEQDALAAIGGWK
ncbi:MAG TPA: ATP-grasp domain-containing protein [Conexivisphaerales archaeon]|nr:ATP-grasp domain-containing protein [Conexivisphaerales archaeon]